MTTLVLIDTSALARRRNSRVSETIAKLVAENVAATCVTIDLEAGYSGRTAEDLREIAASRRFHFVNLTISEQIADRARIVQLTMAQRGHHRAAGVVDLLTAAIAEHHGASILHYDGDFEHIAAVTGQRQHWIAPRGSLD